MTDGRQIIGESLMIMKVEFEGNGVKNCEGKEKKREWCMGISNVKHGGNIGSGVPNVTFLLLFR